jgi:DNA-binding MarR family transcriptional regulator
MRNERTAELAPTLCIREAMRRASRAVNLLYDSVLQPTGLKSSQFSLLRAIGEAGELSQHQFAREHAISVATLSRRFGIGRQSGFLQLPIGAHGERLYSLTDLGREKLEKAIPYWRRAQERLLAASDIKDAHELVAFADAIVVAALRGLDMRRANTPVSSSSPIKRPSLPATLQKSKGGERSPASRSNAEAD